MLGNTCFAASALELVFLLPGYRTFWLGRYRTWQTFVLNLSAGLYARQFVSRAHEYDAGEFLESCLEEWRIARNNLPLRQFQLAWDQVSTCLTPGCTEDETRRQQTTMLFPLTLPSDGLPHFDSMVSNALAPHTIPDGRCDGPMCIGTPVEKAYTFELTRFNGFALFLIKRFGFDRTTLAPKKDSRHVPLPDLYRLQDGNVDQALVLTAVVQHVGRTVPAGHYYSYIRRGNDWFHCNDGTHTPCTLGDVLDAEACIALYIAADIHD